MTSPPLTDEQFGVLADRLLRWLKPTGEDSATLRLWLKQIFADARLHRKRVRELELALDHSGDMDEIAAEAKAELTAARVENERLRTALGYLLAYIDEEYDPPVKPEARAVVDFARDAFSSTSAALAPEGEGG